MTSVSTEVAASRHCIQESDEQAKDSYWCLQCQLRVCAYIRNQCILAFLYHLQQFLITFRQATVPHSPAPNVNVTFMRRETTPRCSAHPVCHLCLLAETRQVPQPSVVSVLMSVW